MTDQTKTEEITHVHDISDLCKQTFLDKDTATRTLWVICVFLVTLCGSSIAWALTMSSNVTELQTKAIYQEQKINQLDEMINKKLDILIERSEKAEKERALKRR